MAGQRRLETARSKQRNQKIVLAAASIVLVAVVAFQLPSMLSQGSPQAGASPQPPAATAVAARPTPALATPESSPGGVAAESAWIDHFAPKDPFVAQLYEPGTGSSATLGGVPAQGPPVKERDFVAKDPFVQQISAPTAASSALGRALARSAKPIAVPTQGYLVVLGSVPAGRVDAANRAVVAAQNAGLVGVQVSVVSQRHSHALTIYTGPYLDHATAEAELLRALRVGYSHATIATVSGSAPTL